MTLEVATASRAHPLEPLCGDAAVVVKDDQTLMCVILDGVGHGPKAHQAASRLAALARDIRARDPLVCLDALNEAARGTVGAAGGVLVVQRSSYALSYAGLGNTVARVIGESPQRFVSHDGVLGQRMRSALRGAAQLRAGDVVVMHTDGIASDFDAHCAPALLVSSAGFMARAILKQFAKPYDDAACIVVKVTP